MLLNGLTIAEKLKLEDLYGLLEPLQPLLTVVRLLPGSAYKAVFRNLESMEENIKLI